MDIRIGFVDSGRELAITGVERVSGVSVSQQSEAVALIDGAMENDAAVVEFTDNKGRRYLGRRYLVRSKQIAFVEVDNDTPRTVGFAG